MQAPARPCCSLYSPSRPNTLPSPAFSDIEVDKLQYTARAAEARCRDLENQMRRIQDMSKVNEEAAVRMQCEVHAREDTIQRLETELINVDKAIKAKTKREHELQTSINELAGQLSCKVPMLAFHPEFSSAAVQERRGGYWGASDAVPAPCEYLAQPPGYGLG